MPRWIIRSAVFVVHIVLFSLCFKVSRRFGWFVLLGYGGWLVLFLALLPRWAHRAFGLGQFKRAYFLYNLQRFGRIGKAVKSRLALSVSACELMSGRHKQGRRTLKSITDFGDDDEAKAVFYNNRAHTAWQSQRDLSSALKDVDKAIALRPGVPHFWHTKGNILKAMEKTNESLTCYRQVLDTPGQWLSSDLEAECRFEVGMIWTQQGHIELGRQFFRQVCLVSPNSTWSEKAASRLSPGVPEFGA